MTEIIYGTTDYPIALEARHISFRRFSPPESIATTGNTPSFAGYRLPILTGHCLGDAARHLLHRDDFSFSYFSLSFCVFFRITTKGNTNPDLLYGLDFVLIHMDCSTVIVLMFAHKVFLLNAPF